MQFGGKTTMGKEHLGETHSYKTCGAPFSIFQVERAKFEILLSGFSHPIPSQIARPKAMVLDQKNDLISCNRCIK